MNARDECSDDDGDSIAKTETVELMSGGPAVRVLIPKDATIDTDTVVALLRKLSDWIHRRSLDPGDGCRELLEQYLVEEMQAKTTEPRSRARTQKMREQVREMTAEMLVNALLPGRDSYFPF